MRTALSVMALCLMVAPVTAQWLRHPTPGIPRTADGRPNLAAPAPRTPDGKPDLSGIWDKSGVGLAGAGGLKPDEIAAWARQLVEERREDFGKGHMSVQCLPFGPAAMFDGALSHTNMKIVQTPSLIVLLFAGLEFRQIFMDGRTLEADPHPSWMGYSVGRWEGDTLLVETNGYNDRTWLSRSGHPHTEAMRVTERYRRRDFGHLEIEMTLADPTVYARPWSVALTANLMADTELLEYVCNENPTRHDHWVGTRSDDKESAVTVAPEVLATYAGTYVEQPPTFLRNPGRVIEVVFRDGQLVGKLNGGAEVPLIAQSEARFAGLGGSIEFIKDGPTTTGLRDIRVANFYTFKRTK